MTKDVIDAIRDRRSVRRFEKTVVPDATLGRLLEAATMAPSAGNLQAWFFFVVKEEKKKAELAAAALNQRYVAEAPVAIVVCADLEKAASGYGSRGTSLYCLQETAAATQNLMLAAEAFGLDTCWVGAFEEDKVATVLGTRKDVLRPVVIVPVGYAAEEPGPRPRRAIDEVVKIIE